MIDSIMLFLIQCMIFIAIMAVMVGPVLLVLAWLATFADKPARPDWRD